MNHTTGAWNPVYDQETWNSSWDENKTETCWGVWGRVALYCPVIRVKIYIFVHFFLEKVRMYCHFWTLQSIAPASLASYCHLPIINTNVQNWQNVSNTFSAILVSQVIHLARIGTNTSPELSKIAWTKALIDSLQRKWIWFCVIYDQHSSLPRDGWKTVGGILS